MQPENTKILPAHSTKGSAKQDNPMFSVGQIRLAELSVFNWGSFNELHTARIDPEGTLITGDNGSGKSTLVDGLMALLLPAGKVVFNVAAAQGDRSDRTLVSYMRGSYGSAHDGAGTRIKSKRESAVVTGLRALYKAADGSMTTLAALFWTTQATHALADIKRIYAVSRRNMALKEMLDAFGEANARSLKQWLREDSETTCCDDNFSMYQELYRNHLFMDNKNAPALLSRALGLKKIDDLTELIRKLVLEPSSVREDARKVVQEFGDLVSIHDQLVDARAQKSHLSKLPETGDVIEKSARTMESLSQEKNSLPVYFGEMLARMWEEKLAEAESRLNSVSTKIAQAEVKEKDTTALIERRHEEYLQLGGGRIESLKKEIGHAKERLSRVLRDASEYQKTAETLNLSTVLDEETFIANQSKASSSLKNIGPDTEACEDQIVSASFEYSKAQENLGNVTREIKEIEARPDSNIDVRYQKLRDEMLAAIGISGERCMFLGELIDVKKEDKHWQGAIERALGGLRTTLAVPYDHYSMVTKWLNARHTGLHVRVQVVNGDTGKNRPAEFKPDGYLRKLLWRKHPYRDWLKRHLQKFDLHCVANTVELDRTPFSMTQQGLMHKEKGRFEKKDQNRIDDRRRWYLGFSNRSRLAILNSDKNELVRLFSETEKRLKKAREELKAVTDRSNLLKKITACKWEDVNAPYHQKKMERFQSDLHRLEQAGGNLEKAHRRYESAKIELAQIRKEQNGLSLEQGGIQKDVEHAKAERQKALAEAANGMTDAARELLSKRIGKLTGTDLDRMPAVRRDIEKKLDRLLDSERNRKNNAEKSAISIMSSFRADDKWQVYTVDWQSGIEGLPDYLDYLSRLENEGLPDLVERFAQRLNKHAAQSLAGLNAKLESERDDIVERIDVINRVLKRTEFKQGSHLKLTAKKERYPHVQAFERQLRNVLGQVTSSDDESKFLQLKKVVEILDKASSPGTSHTLESMRLLEPRYQMAFKAEEVITETGTVNDVMDSSSGKSGGEKEAFAGTIVAASLAYVLTPDGNDEPVYCTVFLDEAFSNTAEAVSRRVLRVFKELHIHVNLITPYKNLNLARESASSLLIAERDQDRHDSRLYEVTWNEIDRRLREEKERKLSVEAESLGIEITDTGKAASCG